MRHYVKIYGKKVEKVRAGGRAGKAAGAGGSVVHSGCGAHVWCGIAIIRPQAQWTSHSLVRGEQEPRHNCAPPATCAPGAPGALPPLAEWQDHHQVPQDPAPGHAAAPAAQAPRDRDPQGAHQPQEAGGRRLPQAAGHAPQGAARAPLRVAGQEARHAHGQPGQQGVSGGWRHLLSGVPRWRPDVRRSGRGRQRAVRGCGASGLVPLASAQTLVSPGNTDRCWRHRLRCNDCGSME